MKEQQKKNSETGAWAILSAGMAAALRDAIIIALVSSAVAVIVNACWHPEGIPFIAEEEYDTMVPCPEPGGEVHPMESNDKRLRDEHSFIVDARSAEEFGAWHVERAFNLTYDYLDPTPDAAIENLARAIARSRAQHVAVYGDGDNPDTGEQLGKEISGKGIKNVFFVKGGAPALRGEAKAGSAADEEGQP